MVKWAEEITYLIKKFKSLYTYWPGFMAAPLLGFIVPLARMWGGHLWTCDSGGRCQILPKLHLVWCATRLRPWTLICSFSYITVTFHQWHLPAQLCLPMTLSCMATVLTGPPLEAILVIFGRRALIFFLFESSWKNEKWRHFCAHAQWWSPWRRKNVEKGHLAPSNLTFLIIAIDRNGFRRMKEEGLIYKTLPQIF